MLLTVRRFTASRKWALFGLLACGCADPLSSRLEPGARVVLVDPLSKVVRVQREDETELLVEQGTSAVVVSDAANAAISDSPNRGVRVTIKDGDSAGANVLVRRDYIRPQ